MISVWGSTSFLLHGSSQQWLHSGSCISGLLLRQTRCRCASSALAQAGRPLLMPAPRGTQQLGALWLAECSSCSWPDELS
jgi:hypothetical protein